ncbi:MAG: hypothetical protein Q4A97_06990 [Comamonadaceae bacterium]|nr:hypothetical protein [Comamonadaceae bacterium]
MPIQCTTWGRLAVQARSFWAHKRRALGALALAVGLAQPAASWGFAGVFDAAAQDALRAVGGALSSSTPPPASDKPAASASNAGYTYAPALSAQVRDEVIAHLVNLGKSRGALDAQGEQALREAFGKIDLVALLEPELKKQGYAMHDLGTALTTWLMVHYGILQGANTTDAQNAAVHRQIQQRMAGVADIQSMDDAQKQRVAEALYWFATLAQHGYEQAKQGAQGYSVQAVTDDARQALKSFGFDAEQMKLSDQGFVTQQ